MQYSVQSEQYSLAVLCWLQETIYCNTIQEQELFEQLHILRPCYLVLLSNKCYKTSFWHYLGIYSFPFPLLLGGFTVVLKSSGLAADHQHDCLGVYRMVDVYNDKPVYRQDVGDHYLYYNAAHTTWMIGSRIGHDFGWIKNSSPEHEKNRLPDLRTGWEYQPLARADHLDSHWVGDDHTLHVEILRGELRVLYTLLY